MVFSIAGPEWRNWQTRRTQNPVAARPCGFDPLLRDHFHVKRILQSRWNFPPVTPIGPGVAELADAPDSKSGGRKAVWVRPPPPGPFSCEADFAESLEFPTCHSDRTRSGGTGRRAGLKIRWPQGRVGSTPSSGTIFM